MDDNSLLLDFFISAHNNGILTKAVNTINSFLEDKEHFTLWLYDEKGNNMFKTEGKLLPILLETYEKENEE